jgi:putative SOS response-associated peptidase YedK
MCGRATLVTPDDVLREVFSLDELPEMPPRFNIAPSQPLPIIRTPGRLELVPWGSKFVNAKVESATTKPELRCLVVLDGFYEWRHGDRQPFYFHRADKKPFAVAGVLRSTENAAAIVTCPPGTLISDIHNRMPLVLGQGDWGAWLRGEKPHATLDGFERYAVSTVVNSPKNEDPRCIEPAPEGPAQGELPNLFKRG